jgi:hypothetical protein
MHGYLLNFTSRAPVKRSLFFALLLGSAISLSSSTAAAQLSSAAINGTVRDSSGAVITDAEITLHETSTGTERKTTSNSAGNFAFIDDGYSGTCPVEAFPPNGYGSTRCLETRGSGVTTGLALTFTGLGHAIIRPGLRPARSGSPRAALSFVTTHTAIAIVWLRAPGIHRIVQLLTWDSGAHSEILRNPRYKIMPQGEALLPD